jgi:GMP synthase-like glutamine amidotransferase
VKPVVVLQNFEAESPGTIIDYLQERDIQHEIVHTYRDEKPPRIEKAGAVINMGCPISANEYLNHPFLRAVFQYTQEIVRSDIPYYGLCFGGQILAAAMGARVRRNAHKEIGPSVVNLTEAGAADPIFKDFPSVFPTFQWHSDTFELPEDVELLASSELCRNQAFRSGRMVGVQFHMEVTMQEATRWCDIWRDELDEVGKAAEDVLSEYEKTALEARSLNFLLLDNFFSL